MSRITLSSTFAATGVSGSFSLKDKDFLYYSVSGTFVGTVVIERSLNGGASWENAFPSLSITGVASDQLLIELGGHAQALFRLHCTAYTSGTVTYSFGEGEAVVLTWKDRNGARVMELKEDGLRVYDSQSQTLSASILRDQDGVINRASQNYFFPAANGKAGATSGWLVAAGDNLALATLPASKTASTLIVPLKLKVGMTITAFYFVGQIDSAGGTVTLDANLRRGTAAAAGITDASITTMTQVSVVAQTKVSNATAIKSGISQVVGADEIYYLNISGTTAASTSISLQGIGVTVTEA